MKFLLQQEQDLSRLWATVQSEDAMNQDAIRQFLQDQNGTLLQSEVSDHQLCLEEFESLQRIACQKLLEQRDDEIVRLRANQEEIKRELNVI